jgi:hypothetical protein
MSFDGENEWYNRGAFASPTHRLCRLKAAPAIVFDNSLCLFNKFVEGCKFSILFIFYKVAGSMSKSLF